VTARTCAAIPDRLAVAKSDGSVSRDGHAKPPHLLSSGQCQRGKCLALRNARISFRAARAETAREGFLDFASSSVTAPFQPLSSPDRNTFLARNESPSASFGTASLRTSQSGREPRSIRETFDHDRINSGGGERKARVAARLTRDGSGSRLRIETTRRESRAETGSACIYTLLEAGAAAPAQNNE